MRLNEIFRWWWKADKSTLTAEKVEALDDDDDDDDDEDDEDEGSSLS